MEPSQTEVQSCEQVSSQYKNLIMQQAQLINVLQLLTDSLSKMRIRILFRKSCRKEGKWVK